MIEYIKREDALNALKIARGYCPCAYGEIKRLPVADVAEVRHGHWGKELPYKSVGGEYKKALICSECNSFFVSDGNKPWQMHNFCPNCGAKMDKEAK